MSHQILQSPIMAILGQLTLTDLCQLAETRPEIQHEHLIRVVELQGALDDEFDVGAEQRDRQDHVFY
jgi:hypothetical protein